MSLPGFGVTVLTAGWYATLSLYRGAAGLERQINRRLLLGTALLALTFTIFSNEWLRFWNCGALVLLTAVNTWELCGGVRWPWHSAKMLAERMALLLQAPFTRWGALLDTIKSLKAGKDAARWLPVLAGLALTLPALWLATGVLMDADAVFALVAGNVLAWLERRFGQIFVRLLLSIFCVPFVFSALYLAAHTQKTPQEEKSHSQLDATPAIILLSALDLLYAFFLAVQSAALFGGQTYLQRAGISFAEYARSGFFQLARLSGVNVGIVLTAVWLCRNNKRLRIFATALMGLTAVLLASAIWKMSLYVSAYGLSFKRLLTYWGMLMLAVLLVLTVRKIWRRDFRFFRAAAPAALVGWLLLNYCNANWIVAKYNIVQAERGHLSQEAVNSLLYDVRGYDGLGVLSDALEETDILRWIRENAARDCESWTTWSVGAWMAAKGY